MSLSPSRMAHSIRSNVSKVERMEEMQGRSVIVTGGASGIGRATALLLAREGARVFIGDIDEPGGQAAAEAVRHDGNQAEFLPLDLKRPDSIANFAAAVHDK